MARTGILRVIVPLLVITLTGCSGAMALRVKSGSSMIYGYADGGDLGDTIGVKIGSSPTRNTMSGRGTGKVFYILNVMPGDYFINAVNFGILSTDVGRIKAAPQEPGRLWSIRLKRPGFYYMGAIKMVKEPGGMRSYRSMPIQGPGKFEALDVIYEKLHDTPWGEKIEKELTRLERVGY